MTPGEKFKVATDLSNLGLAMKRQQFRRQHPAGSEAEIDELMHAWLLDRPLEDPPHLVRRAS